MNQDRVQQLLEDWQLSDENRYQLIELIRQLILELHPKMKEEVKYGGLLFGIQSHFCGIFSYSKHISIEFGEGAQLEDPYQVLEGKGKFRRHIKIETEKDIKQKQLSQYLQSALKLAQSVT